MLQADPTLAAAISDEGQTALFFACRESSLEMAAAFADNGGDLEHPDHEILAGRGIDIEHSNAMGWTPLQAALTYNAAEAAVALAKASANLHRKSMAGWTPRKFATQLGPTIVLETDRRARRARRALASSRRQLDDHGFQ
jgi:ankyrin repeat protein